MSYNDYNCFIVTVPFVATFFVKLVCRMSVNGKINVYGKIL
jgi:hypothetical protein